MRCEDQPRVRASITTPLAGLPALALEQTTPEALAIQDDTAGECSADPQASLGAEDARSTAPLRFRRSGLVVRCANASLDASRPTWTGAVPHW